MHTMAPLVLPVPVTMAGQDAIPLTGLFPLRNVTSTKSFMIEGLLLIAEQINR
jgi:hypothetical protein